MRLFWSFILFLLLIDFVMPDAFAKKHRSHRQREPQEKNSNAPVVGPENLAAEVNRIVNSMGPNLNVGIQIKSMKNGSTLYTKNDRRLFVPASILKIFTAESALLYLGHNFTFNTRFVTDATSISEGILYGNLYLVHSGDPSLTYFDLEDMMATLKSKHIQKITGNVYIDDTAYDQEIYAPGWVWNDKRFCYAAPISASIINHNCMTFRLSPAKAVGHPAIVLDNGGSPIQSNVITRSTRSRSCYIRLGAGSNNSLTVSGCMPKGNYSQGVTSVVTDVLYYNKILLSKLFNRYGIRVNGSILAGVSPLNLTSLATHRSEPLNTLITEMLKKSDNIIAGSLFKKLGETYFNRPGSWENGSNAVTEILAKQTGVDTSRMNLTDGSGLSRYNLITPAQMMHVLNFAYHHTGTNYDFISALPVAGIDGTLKHRLHNVAWKIRAKTGTMSGVVALAGYAINRDKEPIAFVIIFNGRMGMGWKYKSLEDKIVTALTRYTQTAY
jgi:serine-type D-Ala-D-Ala carboxypeptidase/endopeptidase (penicillin-binding protein 4)